MASQKKKAPLSFGPQITGRAADREAALAPLLDTVAGRPDAAAYPLTLEVAQLRRGPFQPRDAVSDESVQELASTVRTVGLLQPILVRPVAGEADAYEILAGERRWHAARLAGLQRVPVLVRNADDDTAAAIGLVENLQRRDLNPLEKAAGLRRLMDQFQLSQARVASTLGMDRTVVNRLLALLSLAPAVQDLLRVGRLEANHGRALIGLPRAEQERLANKAIRHGWSVQALERARRGLERSRSQARAARQDPDIQRLQAQLSERIGNPVQVRHCAGSGRVRMVVEFSSLEEFQGALERMGLTPPDDPLA